MSIFFGGKYDLIQLHGQIIHTSKCSEFLFHHKNNITISTFGLKSKENNENDMTSVVWAGTVNGPRLWPLSARHHSLADYGSLRVPQITKSCDALIEVFKFIRYV